MSSVWKYYYTVKDYVFQMVSQSISYFISLLINYIILTNT
jgi:hypothetical protein